MPWAVDTCILIDIAENDPRFGVASAEMLKSRLEQGLVVCPVTVVELAPVFAGRLDHQKAFFDLCGIDHSQSFLPIDAERAHAAWQKFVAAKRRGKAVKRPVGGVLIGGFALRFEGLITRNGRDFRRWFPSLQVIDPTSPR